MKRFSPEQNHGISQGDDIVLSATCHGSSQEGEYYFTGEKCFLLRKKMKIDP
jgi:hypothetical protein